MAFGFQTVILNITSPYYLKTKPKNTEKNTKKMHKQANLLTVEAQKKTACLLFLKNLSNIAGVITQMAWLKKKMSHAQSSPI